MTAITKVETSQAAAGVWFARTLRLFGMAALLTTVITPATSFAQVEQADTYSGGKSRVNNSAKLRALTEGIAAVSCQLSGGIASDTATTALARMQGNFNTILAGLENGNPALGMPGAERSSVVKRSIGTVRNGWEPMNAAVTAMLDGAASQANVVSTGRATLFDASVILASDVSGQYSDPQELLQSDAITFNFIGRQRELANSMSRMICELATGTGSGATREELQQAVSLFEASLNALREGFPNAGISPPPNDAVSGSLDQMLALWTEGKPVFDAVLGGATATENDVTRVTDLVADLSVVINNTVTLYLISSPGQSGVYRVPLTAYTRDELATWLVDPDLIAAVKAQNLGHADLTEDAVIALDQDWRAQAKAGGGPLIDKLINEPVSQWLLARQNATAGFVTEVFVMDNKGLNVAQSAVTSDYWQGDEAKWQETYNVGPDALHISDVEFDDSTGFYQSQASLPITDPETGDIIGAVTFGVNVQSLM
ncbi:type IV pili methyl-accepting chemotaxis transducer N-terminal domain-containing protein [Yoonia sp.]|uniref:type IV pili methyl-accepting chemotaxis transducer N-terminal domain-containing protein n=1 Tax=Yoonia sp. TaxID=2212373 RepID=UPI003F6D0594